MISIIPYLRYAGYYKHVDHFPSHHVFPKRTVYYYELEFFHCDNMCKIVLDDVVYTFPGNTVIFRQPGQVNVSYMPYESYVLCFSFDPFVSKDLCSFDFDGVHEMQTKFIHPLISGISPVQSNLSLLPYREYFQTIYHELLRSNPLAEAIYTSYILQILYHLNNENERSITIDSGKNYSIQHPMLLKVVDYIDGHIHHKITVTDISQALSISERYIHELFKAHMHTTPNQYINLMKINIAKNLLLTSNLSISEIGFYCGFENTPYFSSLFKKKVGMSPLQYRTHHYRK